MNLSGDFSDESFHILGISEPSGAALLSGKPVGARLDANGSPHEERCGWFTRRKTKRCRELRLPTKRNSIGEDHSLRIWTNNQNVTGPKLDPTFRRMPWCSMIESSNRSLSVLQIVAEVQLSIAVLYSVVPFVIEVDASRCIVLLVDPKRFSTSPRRLSNSFEMDLSVAINLYGLVATS